MWSVCYQWGFPCLVIVLPRILIVCVEKVLSVIKEPQENISLEN